MSGVISKIAEKVRNSKIARACCAATAAVTTGAVSTVTALAGNIDESMTTALTTAFEGIKQDVISLINVALPAGLVITGIGIAVSLGIKFFKKFAK